MGGLPRITDAEIVRRLQIVRDEGTHAKAAAKIGIAVRNVGATVQLARARGLTADTKIVDTEDRLRTENKVLKAELAARIQHNLEADEIRRTIYGLAAMKPEPPKWVVSHKAPKSSGVPMTMWSDWHYGETVNRDEMNGTNEFNRAIAKRRVRRLVETTIDLAKNHMTKPKYPGLVLCLGGDMISGDIHEELAETNDGSVQQSVLEVGELLIWGIEQMADAFKRLYIPCVVGNHARTTRKPRAKRRVYMSHEWLIYQHLERYFKNDKRIQFSIPGASDAAFTVAGHRFLLTHGDTLGTKGGDGLIGALGPITRGSIKVGRSEAHIGRDFDTLLMGHWHTYIPRSDASAVIVNGALKGYDEYARTLLRLPYARPSQALWWVHPKHGITAQWPVWLEDQPNPVAQGAWVQWKDAA